MKYIFKAEFLDGTSYTQNHEDIPLAGLGHGSCFSDIQERVRNGEVTKFTLTGDGQVHSVDLTDGHFEVNGVPFDCASEHTRPPLSNFRVIYLRRSRRYVKQHIEVREIDGKLQPVVTGSEDAGGEVVGFKIGWQANDAKGNNYQQTIEVK